MTSLKNSIRFWKEFLLHRKGWKYSENTKFYGNWVFCFLGWWRLFSFLNFMKMWANLKKATLREAWTWHSRSKIHKITGKSGLELYKLFIFFSRGRGWGDGGVYLSKLFTIFLKDKDTVKNLICNADVSRSFYFLKYWALCLSWENVNLISEIS